MCKWVSVLLTMAGSSTLLLLCCLPLIFTNYTIDLTMAFLCVMIPVLDLPTPPALLQFLQQAAHSWKSSD